MRGKKTFVYFLRISGVLTLICTLVAALISVVFALTDDVYQANLLATKQASISALFEQQKVECENLPCARESVQEVYRVTRNGELLGFCANVSSSGFGGEVNMMVAVAPDGRLLGVDIVAMSETPGLGSRVGEEEYLSQYQGLNAYGSPLDESVDAISGATISSRAVMTGVQTALDALSEFILAEVTVR